MTFNWRRMLQRLIGRASSSPGRRRVRPTFVRLEDRITPVTDQLGLYVDGAWIHQTLGTPKFGIESTKPVVGDWNGSGTQKIGVYFEGKWYLDWNGNGTWDGPSVDRLLQFGRAGFHPVVGDWNGDGRDQLGVYKDGVWYLDWNSDGAWNGEQTDRKFNFGYKGALPVVGDWNGNGKDQLGVYDKGAWFLDWNNNRVWDAADRIFRFGFDGARPVVGDWNGNGKDQLGVFHKGTWYLDVHADGVWNGPSQDLQVQLGSSGMIPIVGRGRGALRAVNDTFTTAEDQTLTVAAPGVLQNDRGAGNGRLPAGAKAQLVTGPASGTLQLRPNGSFTYTPAADFNGEVTFTYRIVLGALRSNVATVRIQVTGVNDPPVVTGATFSVDENADAGTAVGTPITFTDPDAGQTHTFAITAGNTDGAFAINASTGQITVANPAALDFETNPVFALTITVTDNGAPVLSGTATVTVNVNNLAPSEPVDADEAANTVAEGAAGGTVVGITAFSTDPAGGTVTYELTDDADGRFVIDANTGVVSVAAGAEIDFESSEGSYTIAVRATDGLLFSTETTFQIAVTNVAPSAPVDDDSSDNVVAEGAAAGTTVGITALSTDPAGGTVTYELTDDADGRFVIDANTGVVSVAAGAEIDFESSEGSYTIAVRATDGLLFSTETTFQIAVTNVAPSAPVDDDSSDNVVAEGAAAGTTVGITALSTDPAGGTVTYELTDDAEGRFVIDADTGIVTVADGAVIDVEDGSYDITVRASDGQLTSAETTFTIDVTGGV